MHLLRHGFMPSYNCWTKHGERGVRMEEDEEGDDIIDDNYPDHFGDTFMEDAEGGEGEGEGCDNGIKLGCTLDLPKWKAQKVYLTLGFENLLKMMKNVFPKNNELPASTKQRRSSVASTEAPASANAPTIEIRAPEPHYPVDDVNAMKECDLHYPVGNISTKVAIGSALPCTPGALHHNNPIQDGYARVTVEDIVQGFEDLEIDYATTEGETKLGDVKRRILWKEVQVFQARRQAQVHPPPGRGGGGGGRGVVVHLHLLHVTRRCPPIHL
ncbi:hypothetical protein QYE76_005222 [Lolium multiflorum]|uniref:DUF8039 domain-containing protein n=1 Tax=Lolium multiflorum TaxID=4521 RepID=A0AAD8RU08_LOLMU|nr:hypothetical protein QYE76_005222 [Lolium multiflorum]